MRFPELVEGYIGPNPSHATFKRAIVNEKVFVFILSSNKEQLLTSFSGQIENLRASVGEKFSLGMVTKGISTSEFQGMIIPHNEVRLVTDDFNQFMAQIYAKVYADLHRIFVTYLIELYAEIARTDPRILKSKKQISFEDVLQASEMHEVRELLVQKQKLSLSHADRETIMKEFTSIGLPVICASDSSPEEYEALQRSLTLLWSTRNIIEHNNAVVNELFLKANPGTEFRLGDLVTIGIEEIGAALATVEFIADRLNIRAIAKFGLGRC